MTECAACGNRLSTDSPSVCLDEERDLAACPHSGVIGDDATAGADAAVTHAASGASVRGDGGTTTASTAASDAARPRATNDGSTPDPGRSAGTASDARPFAVKTAGRSLEPPRSAANAGASRNDGRGRVGSLLATALDVLR